MVKALKNILHIQKAESWNIASVQMKVVGWPLIFYRHGQIAPSYICMKKMLNNHFLSKCYKLMSETKFMIKEVNV